MGASERLPTANVTTAGEYQVVVCDSLEKVYGIATPRPHALGGTVALPRRGTGSFQLAIKPGPLWMAGPDGGVRATVDCPEDVSVSCQSVDLVPCPVTASPRADEHYDHTGPALLPDVLRPLAEGECAPLARMQWRSLWFTVRAGDAPGLHQITVQLESEYRRDPIATIQVPVVVVNIELPESPITCTQWFHVDALAHQYRTAPYSAQGWNLIDRFMRAAVASGSTAILTPIHTPPLDTAVGSRRLDVGLVGVQRSDTGYTFDMSRLEKWLRVCGAAGVRELEMAHLFTQWGGEHAPAIDDMAGRSLFGWHTDSFAEDYHDFLGSYLPAVRRVLDNQWPGKVFWHLTDEPHSEHASRYSQLKAAVAPLLRGCLVTDALSDLDLWTSGLVDPPIVSTDHAQPFVDAGLENPWLYYCTGQSQRVSNRFISLPSYRNRVLGWQLYRYGSRGFLHWGFNFWGSQLSRRPLDPFTDTSAGSVFQAGEGFIVYPGPDGTPWESIRFRVFREAMDDVALLTALGDRHGPEWVTSLLELDDLTLTDYPHEPAHYVRGHAAALQSVIPSD
ncbi:DUF4091 domain-containing protein [Propionibacteriaceae bacterium Y2011]